MKAYLYSTVLVAATLCAAQAPADDSMSHVTMTKSQMMKDCIEKQKTADVTMSKAAMKRMCRDQLKAQKETGTPTDPPPVDKPAN
jgi:hypothetical protein